MKSLFAKAGLALALSATALTVAAPADAQRYGGRYRGHDNTGTAIVAGVAGLAIGAALASNGRDRYYDDGYYDQGYYGPDYYDRGYAYDGYYRAPPVVIYNQRYVDRRYYNRGYRGYDGGYRGGYGRGGYGGGGRGGYGGHGGHGGHRR